jgi:hypothetical protein
MTSETIQTELKTTKSGLVKHKENPFIEGGLVQLKIRRKNIGVAMGAALVDPESGEVAGMTTIAQRIEVDAEEFVKLFTKDISVFFDFTPTAIRTFAVLLKAVQKSAINRDKVYFRYEELELANCNLPSSVFYRGIKELIDKQFLAKAEAPNWYFLNPSLIFNGDRARFIKEYHIKKGVKMTDSANAFYAVEQKCYAKEAGKTLAQLSDADNNIIEQRASQPRKLGVVVVD